jgi:hypothetical protein
MKIHFNIICQLSLCFPSGLFPTGLPIETPYAPFLSPIRATCPVHLILLDFITPLILGEVQMVKILRMYFFPFPRYFHLLEPVIFLSISISNHLSETELMLSYKLDKVNSVQYRTVAVVETRKLSCFQ